MQRQVLLSYVTLALRWCAAYPTNFAKHVVSKSLRHMVMLTLFTGDADVTSVARTSEHSVTSHSLQLAMGSFTNDVTLRRGIITFVTKGDKRTCDVTQCCVRRRRNVLLIYKNRAQIFAEQPSEAMSFSVLA